MNDPLDLRTPQGEVNSFPTPPPNKKHRRDWIQLLLIALIVIVAFAIGYLLYSDKATPLDRHHLELVSYLSLVIG